VIPSSSAAAASTGIPLTHRDVASAVTFATAHARADQPERDGDLAPRVPREGTVVFYMGLARLAETAAALIAGGRAPTTPAAVVSHATLPTERTVVSDLANVARAAGDARLEAPALLIVGEVVARRVCSAEPTEATRSETSRHAPGP
jgi:siroheme synthase